MVSADGSRGGVSAGGAWARLRPEALTSPGALPARAMKHAEAQLGTWGAPPEARLQAEMALGVGLRLPVCPSEPVTHAPGQGSSQLQEAPCHHGRWHGGAAGSREPLCEPGAQPRASPVPAGTTCLQFLRNDDGAENSRCCLGGVGDSQRLAPHKALLPRTQESQPAGRMPRPWGPGGNLRVAPCCHGDLGVGPPL